MQFTVVVPSLNQGHFIGQALGSLLNQEVGSLEIIVVDGGSTDGSVDVIEAISNRLGGTRFGANDGRGRGDKCTQSDSNVNRLWLPENRVTSVSFHWCSEPDQGQSHAFNKGFDRATGRFLFWLNADDLLLPGTLARVQKMLTSGLETQWIAGNQIYINAEGKIIRCSCGNSWHNFLYQHAPVHVYGPSSFFNAELWKRVGGVDECLQYCMDWDLWLRFKEAGAHFERLDHYCWALRRHGGSKTQGGEPSTVNIRWAEVDAMLGQHGCRRAGSSIWMQRLWRGVSGCYARSAFDTMRWKGQYVLSIQHV